MRLGYSLPEIESYFKEIFKNKEREVIGYDYVPIGGKMEKKEVYEVPIELPRYRLDNTRTLPHQKKYITDHQLNDDFFESDIWLDKLQQIQHDILKNLIERKGLKEYFTNNIQTQPLILTHDGFVISGNRRLCAIREIYFNTPKGEETYKNFSRLKVLILPKCTDEEIEYIEDYLEQQPDIKDEFSWISKAIGFKRRMDRHGYTSQKLAEKSGFKKADIESLLQQLNLAKEYLQEIGKPDDFELVETDKYAFSEIEKGRKLIKGSSAQRDLFQKLSFIALKNQDKMSGRMYRNIPIIQAHLNDIENQIAEEFETDLQAIKSKPKNNIFNDFSLFNEGSLDTIELLENENIHNDIFDIIKDKIIEVKTLKEESNKKKVVLNKVKEAAALLIAANNIRSNESDKTGILKQISNIEGVLVELKEWAGK